MACGNHACRATTRLQITHLLATGISCLLFVCLLLGWISGCGDSQENTTSGTAASADARVIFTTTSGDKVELNVEVARTAQERAVGLMKRDKLGSDSGMIFIWENPVQSGFWMKDTYIPLSIAFISKDGTIVDIQDMQPLDQSNHMPKSPYIYAVEVNQGWFAQQGIKVGDRAEFVES